MRAISRAAIDLRGGCVYIAFFESGDVPRRRRSVSSRDLAGSSRWSLARSSCCPSRWRPEVWRSIPRGFVGEAPSKKLSMIPSAGSVAVSRLRAMSRWPADVAAGLFIGGGHLWLLGKGPVAGRRRLHGGRVSARFWSLVVPFVRFVACAPTGAWGIRLCFWRRSCSASQYFWASDRLKRAFAGRWQIRRRA